MEIGPGLECDALFSVDVTVGLRRAGWMNEAAFRWQMSKYGVLVVWDEEEDA
jgi:hypothetical protein